MAAQATDDERRAVATWVLDNGGDVAALERQVDDIWPELAAKAKAAAEDPGPE
jgi:dephospho-CoA kinase